MSNSGKYSICFNYRSDYEGDDAFLICNENEVFAVTGMIAEINFIGLEDNEKEQFLKRTKAYKMMIWIFKCLNRME